MEIVNHDEERNGLLMFVSDAAGHLTVKNAGNACDDSRASRSSVRVRLISSRAGRFAFWPQPAMHSHITSNTLAPHSSFLSAPVDLLTSMQRRHEKKLFQNQVVALYVGVTSLRARFRSFVSGRLG